SGFLDWIARWIVPPPRLAFSGVGAAPTAQGASELPDQSPEHPGPQIVMMDDSLRGTRWGKGDDNPGGHGPPAPPKPWHEHGYPDPTSGPAPPAAFIAESKKKCNYYRLEGMHGRPCRSLPGAGGSDTKCPTGTVSGWFWKYDVPAYGTVYYVDCCGKSISGGVWCNWSKEQNWCVIGKASHRNDIEWEVDPSTNQRSAPLYTCTLALLACEFKWHMDPGMGSVVDGVD